MADEYFYGITLENAGASVTWDPVGNADTELQTANFKLHIKQILLGHTAKEGEYNVVQVETMSLRDTVKIPIAVLKVGETRSVMTDLEFPDAPVIFKLIEGNGPVHIHGQHRPDSYDLEDIEEMEEEILDEEEGDEDEEDDGNARKKIKLATNNSKPLPKGGAHNSNNKNNKKK